MKKHVHAIALVGVLCLCGGVSADDTKPANWIGSVRGEILKIDRDLYLVEDVLGREVALQLNSTVEKDESLQVGDEVLVRIIHRGKEAFIKSLKKISSLRLASSQREETSRVPLTRSQLAETTRLPVAPSQLTDISTLPFASSQLTEGQLLTIRGDSYVLQDISGRRIRLHVDANTWKDGNITTGDTILAAIDYTKFPAHAESLIKR
jgi:uncharacterized protein YdeI (BOF family)